MKFILIIIFYLSYFSKSYAFCLFNCDEITVNLTCDEQPLIVDKKYMYEYFGKAVNKYKIVSRDDTYVSGYLKGKSGFTYDVTLNLVQNTLIVNKKNRNTGISGSYTKNCY